MYFKDILQPQSDACITNPVENTPAPIADIFGQEAAFVAKRQSDYGHTGFFAERVLLIRQNGYSLLTMNHCIRLFHGMGNVCHPQQPNTERAVTWTALSFYV
ncbi:MULTISPECIES: hypothetical protein [Halomonadaceae]|uniref:hypothetical protein n=1 Tax=Halomonadaceae TaxID=28256 RepID=UPI00038D3C6D|nr:MULTISPECIES: hypothetical protein [Halomonas]UEQ05037.1 hypothetical protein LMS44_04010 [Halomonas profundus]MCD1586736.1 hypothetical protein [Halomonas sp. IOP_14]NVE90235.1 hypothetical protein [Halomonas titanicae]QNU62767.1 hypothetical protein HZS52_24090 [Halomonas titanicae]CAD5269207.1 conserved hypothetical protein [Halomonas sp. I3]